MNVINNLVMDHGHDQVVDYVHTKPTMAMTRLLITMAMVGLV
jgi:hypothetical protein